MNQEKPSMLPAALIGGVFLGVTSALPILEFFNCLCCLLVIAGGVLASFIYLRDYPDSSPRMSYGDGALLGLFTGLVGGLVWTVVEVPLAYLKLRLGMSIEEMAEVEELLSDPNIPPFVQELVTSILAGGALSIGILIFLLFTHLIIAGIFACIGGVIGVALFQKKTPVAYQAPVVSTTPPPIPDPEQQAGKEDGGQGT